MSNAFQYNGAKEAIRKSLFGSKNGAVVIIK
jgi:hypothetical protein